LILVLGQGQQVPADHFQVGKLNGREVVTLVLGEAEQKHCPPVGPVGNDRAVAAAFTTAQPGDSELNQPAAKLGGDKPAFCLTDRIREGIIEHCFLPRKARESMRLKYPHRPPAL
jgi:hypothetical protein